nr:LysR family transcriptional regulator [Liquorilactobacillus satsumensis]
MNLKQLSFFITIAEEGQITAAAKRLHIAQPPLSYQIKQLELELGVELFKRTSRGIKLTEEGKLFRKYALQIVDLTQLAQSKLKAAKKGVGGATIVVGSISSSVKLLPSQKLRNLQLNYPGLKFEIIEDNTYGVIEKLRKKMIEIAIVRTPFNGTGLQMQYFPSEPMAAIFPREFQAHLKAQITLQELVKWPLVTYRRFSSQFEQTFLRAGLTPQIAVTCDDARTALRWADCGYGGVALIPSSVTHTDTLHEVVPVACHAWETQLALVWPKEHLMTPFLRDFITAFSSEMCTKKN